MFPLVTQAIQAALDIDHLVEKVMEVLSDNGLPSVLAEALSGRESP